jgi:hypothetical protein
LILVIELQNWVSSTIQLLKPFTIGHQAVLWVVLTFLFTVYSLFGWLVADGWCWFLLREEYCWLVAGGWFVLREKYCWLVADKPSEQAVSLRS